MLSFKRDLGTKSGSCHLYFQTLLQIVNTINYKCLNIKVLSLIKCMYLELTTFETKVKNKSENQCKITSVI